MPAANPTGRRPRGPWARRSLVALAIIALIGVVLVQRHGGDRLTDTQGATVIRTDVRSPMLERTLEQIVILPRGYSPAR